MDDFACIYLVQCYYNKCLSMFFKLKVALTRFFFSFLFLLFFYNEMFIMNTGHFF